MIRVEVNSEAGEEAERRFGVRFTPNFVVFDRGGHVVGRTSVVGDAAARLRSLVATP